MDPVNQSAARVVIKIVKPVARVASQLSRRSRPRVVSNAQHAMVPTRRGMRPGVSLVASTTLSTQAARRS